jgi:hypothetical protein
MPELVQELKWALMLETDEDMLRESKEGREIRKQLKKLEKGVKKICRVCDKIDPGEVRKEWKKMENKEILVVVLIWLAGMAIGWLVSCGVFWLIALCFGWNFSWAWATGLWLVWIVLKSLFKKG